MAKVAKRLAGPALLTGAAATKYTAPSYVPTTLQTVVRKFHFFNSDSADRAVTLSIGADAAGTRLLDAKVLSPLESYDLYGPHTLGPGEIIQAFCDVTSEVTLTIDGEENV